MSETNERAFLLPPDKCKVLAGVLRNRAQAMLDENDESDSHIRDSAELLKVLARMVEGKTVYQAFGAPGDWGHETPIGEALSSAYR